MPRLLSIATVAAAALFMGYGASPASARTAPWCSVTHVGLGNVVTSCSFRSFQQCLPYVLGGNRGFCQQNPYYAGPPSRKEGRYSRRGRWN